MDLRPITTPPSHDEQDAVDALLGPAPVESTVPRAEADRRRRLLLPALHAVTRRTGWVSPGALGYIAARLSVPPAEAYGVASFYALFPIQQRAPTVVHVCDDIGCRARGADRLVEELERTHGPAGRGEAATWLRSPCLGLCERAPAALCTRAGRAPSERAWGPATAAEVTAVLGGNDAPAPPPTTLLQDRATTTLLSRVGLPGITTLDGYRAHGGYAALRRALEQGPGWVLRELTDSKLVGRGGAAFPTGRKWTAVAQHPARPHQFVCNADESEPGTFKDRVLMEEDPFSVAEAMTLGGITTGAARGFLYLRGEYPLALARMEAALAEARAHGLLGADVMGRGVAFDIEIRRGAGAYICGEETALFNSIEGFRGEPRAKPPFPVDAGLFGHPTVVNNVETLCNVLPVVLRGGAAFAATGTAGSAGTKLFCVSGHVARPGLYEMRLGTRLSDLLALAGGVASGRKPRAVLLGGAAGTFLGPDELDVPLTFEDTRRLGATLGSGVVMVFDDTTDLLGVLRRLAHFFRDESCGQCVPCRVGTVRVEELLDRAAAGTPLGSAAQERALLADLAAAMREASICGLGQTATSALESAVHKLGILKE